MDASAKKTAFKTQNESLLKNTAKLEGGSTSQLQHFADRFEQNDKKQKDKILTYPVFRLSAGTLCIAKEFEAQWLLKKY